MYHSRIRRFILIRPPLKSIGPFSLTPFRSLRFLSTSSEIKQKNAIAFFENHGFSKSQISLIFKKMPRLLSAKPEKSLLPKLLFLQTKGLSSAEVANLVTCYPYFLIRSLDKHIIPSFNYFHELLQSEDKTVATIKRYVCILDVNLRSCVRPNIEVLRQFGVPQNNIASLFRMQPRLLTSKPLRLKEIVEEVKELGVNPLSYTFVLALSTRRGLSNSTWKKKVEVYGKWGCPEEEVLSAFRRHPVCMLSSEDKINGVMDYFVNKIGCESSFITRNPAILCFSLKRRIIPRGSVYLVLSSKGLIKKDVTLCFFNLNEKKFLEKFIKPHEKHILGLLKLYEEKLELSASISF